MKLWGTLLLAVTASAAGGFFIGRSITSKSGPGSNGDITINANAATSGTSGPKLIAGSVADKARAAAIRGGTLSTADEFKKALALAMKDPSPVQRFSNLTKVLENLSDKNLPDVLKAFEDIPVRSEHVQEYQMLLFAWASFDPKGALEYAVKKGSARGIGKDQLMQPVITAWAQNEPQKALDWINSLPEKDRQQQGLLRGLIDGWAVKDPEGATKYLATLPEDKNRERLVGQIAGQLIKTDVDGATKWAESIQNPKLREQAFEELVEDWSSMDPAAAAKWLTKHMKDDYSVEAVEDLARGWASVDSKAASKWFEDLPEGKAKQQGVYNLAKTWAGDDLKGLSEWLNGLGDSTATDHGVKGYAEQLAGKSPDAALGSASSIGDAQMRDNTMSQIAQQWYMQDQTAATAWAEQNNFPVERMQPQLPNADQLREGMVKWGIDPAGANMQEAQNAARMIQEAGLKIQQLRNLTNRGAK